MTAETFNTGDTVFLIYHPLKQVMDDLEGRSGIYNEKGFIDFGGYVLTDLSGIRISKNGLTPLSKFMNNQRNEEYNRSIEDQTRKRALDFARECRNNGIETELQAHELYEKLYDLNLK